MASKSMWTVARSLSLSLSPLSLSIYLSIFLSPSLSHTHILSLSLSRCHNNFQRKGVMKFKDTDITNRIPLINRYVHCVKLSLKLLFFPSFVVIHSPFFNNYHYNEFKFWAENEYWKYLLLKLHPSSRLSSKVMGLIFRSYLLSLSPSPLCRNLICFP